MTYTFFTNDHGQPRLATVELPLAPQTASPVPGLTSIHSVRDRGPYGDRSYRGNCGGYLIKDLLNYFQPNNVLDLMSGSGTCRDVCRELSIPCHNLDLHSGDDAADPASYEPLETFDFIWMHPPYWRMIRYNDDPRCLSRAPTLDAFLDRLQAVFRNARRVLSDRGKIAILIGGYTERGRYIPLAHLAMQRAMAEGLWPACTEIIRFQHGNTSSRKAYTSSFIPGLYDICLIFERDDSSRS